MTGHRSGQDERLRSGFQGARAAWVNAPRETSLRREGRGEIGDDFIGQLLSKAPVGDDGLWPCEPVRELLEQFASHNMGSGFAVGTHNRRGVTIRGVFDVGGQERTLVEEYGRQANEIAARWPNTAAACAAYSRIIRTRSAMARPRRCGARLPLDSNRGALDSTYKTRRTSTTILLADLPEYLEFATECWDANPVPGTANRNRDRLKIPQRRSGGLAAGVAAGCRRPLSSGPGVRSRGAAPHFEPCVGPCRLVRCGR